MFVRQFATLAVVLGVLSSPDVVHAGSVLSIASVGARSHLMNLLRVGQELVDRGHTFSVLISSADKISQQTFETRKVPGMQALTFRGNEGVGTSEWAANLSRDPFKSITEFMVEQSDVARSLCLNSTALHLLKQQDFDLLLYDAAFCLANVLQHKLDVPSVALWPVPTSPVGNRNIPNPVAYYPQLGTTFYPVMSFWQRVQNYLQSVLLELLILPTVLGPINNFVKQAGLDYPLYQTGWSYYSATILVGDWALEFPHALPPTHHMVGPLLAEEPKQLPTDLSNFLDQALSSEHPAVYVSLGTFVTPKEEELLSMVQGLSALPNPVLWKLDPQLLPGNTTVESLHLGANIKTIEWAPQNDILGHPGVGAFLTQGGINSLYEAAYHAKPLVTIPLVADQEGNAVKAEYHGFGLTVKPSKLFPVNGKAVQDAVQHVLHTPAFKDNAKKVSKRLKNKPRHPAKLAADVVERVLFTDGDRYLWPHGDAMPWWQLSLLDVKAFLGVAALLIGSLVGLICIGVARMVLAGCRHLWHGVAQSKVHKQKSV